MEEKKILMIGSGLPVKTEDIIPDVSVDVEAITGGPRTEEVVLEPELPVAELTAEQKQTIEEMRKQYMKMYYEKKHTPHKKPSNRSKMSEASKKINRGK
jgi:hypothetical protein